MAAPVKVFQHTGLGPGHNGAPGNRAQAGEQPRDTAERAGTGGSGAGATGGQGGIPEPRLGGTGGARPTRGAERAEDGGRQHRGRDGERAGNLAPLAPRPRWPRSAGAAGTRQLGEGSTDEARPGTAPVAARPPFSTTESGGAGAPFPVPGGRGTRLRSLPAMLRPPLEAWGAPAKSCPALGVPGAGQRAPVITESARCWRHREREPGPAAQPKRPLPVCTAGAQRAQPRPPVGFVFRRFTGARGREAAPGGLRGPGLAGGPGTCRAWGQPGAHSGPRVAVGACAGTRGHPGECDHRCERGTGERRALRALRCARAPRRAPCPRGSRPCPRWVPGKGPGAPAPAGAAPGERSAAPAPGSAGGTGPGRPHGGDVEPELGPAPRACPAALRAAAALSPGPGRLLRARRILQISLCERLPERSPEGRDGPRRPAPRGRCSSPGTGIEPSPAPGSARPERGYPRGAAASPTGRAGCGGGGARPEQTERPPGTAAAVANGAAPPGG
ncbi:collagen alpha-1(I) chain-like [Melozone crissalis]|uniref:collagen alpha-1(I) chain-like n=1 Tax=Melozone crissalis TaxID=40204 RepID=UPI0023DB50DA|nr:collagen alpha-1(I) chain-like [Melozone crissalis]